MSCKCFEPEGSSSIQYQTHSSSNKTA